MRNSYSSENKTVHFYFLLNFTNMKKITILIHCKDQSGIIAAVTNFIASKNGNIVYIDQHVDQEQQAVFFMRLEGEFEDRSYNKTQISLLNFSKKLRSQI